MSTIVAFERCPDPKVAEQLERFEGQFHYPLGQHGWFRISHGSDYTRFFRAIGEARCFVARRDSEVTGVISVSRPTLYGPNGEPIEAAYVSDLKVAASAGGRTLLRLLREAASWARLQPATPGFSIVMDGTTRSPLSYTGRLGIPSYVELAQLMIVRIPCRVPSVASTAIESSLQEVRERHRCLSAGRFVISGGDSAERSQGQPIGLISHDGNGCGIVEDTRRCKLLYREDGSEIVSAHLSSFGYQTPDGAAKLLRAAMCQCWQMNMPALFVSLPRRESHTIVKLLDCSDVMMAPATVFGLGFPQGADWSVNTSEI